MEIFVVECWRSFGEAYGGSLEKLRVEGKGSLWWKLKERKKIGKGKENGKGE